MDNFCKNYIDERGCLVCKDAMPPESAQAGREDSAHKAAFYNFYLYKNFKEHFFENMIPPNNYVKIQGLVRHPYTRYTTSRDQILPFLIMLDYTNFVMLKKIVEYQIKHCYVEKEEMKKWSWLIKRFYHAPNGDIFLLPNHLSAVFRVMRKKWYWLTDILLPFVVLATLFRRNDGHLVSQVMQYDYFNHRNPTIFSKIASFMFFSYHNRCKIAKNYFSGEINPPIYILMNS